MAIDMTIEEVTDLDADWEDLVALLDELNQYHVELGLAPLKPGYEARWRGFIALGPERLILIARYQEDVLGYINARINQAALLDETVGFIDDAFVRPIARRKGVGEALLAKVEAWCRDKGMTEVRLNVLAANDIGMKFWSKSGYGLFSHTLAKTLDVAS